MEDGTQRDVRKGDGDRQRDGRQAAIDRRQAERWETGRQKDRETGDVVKEEPLTYKMLGIPNFFCFFWWGGRIPDIFSSKHPTTSNLKKIPDRVTH